MTPKSGKEYIQISLIKKCNTILMVIRYNHITIDIGVITMITTIDGTLIAIFMTKTRVYIIQPINGTKTTDGALKKEILLQSLTQILISKVHITTMIDILGVQVTTGEE